MPTITPISRTVTPSVSVQNRPATNLTVTPASRPNNPVQVTVQSRTVQVGIGSPNVGGQVYTHTQSTPAATWTIPNTPGARALVLGIYDSSGRMGWADVIVTNTNTVITFSQPRTGSVDYLRG